MTIIVPVREVLIDKYNRVHHIWGSFFEALSKSGLNSRGDPSANDFTIVSFTADATWRDLDLSAILPVGTKAVVLRIGIQNDTAGQSVSFRKNGNSNASNSAIVYTPVANVPNAGQNTVFCDANRVIEYYATNGGTWASINVCVMGWYL